MTKPFPQTSSSAAPTSAQEHLYCAVEQSRDARDDETIRVKTYYLIKDDIYAAAVNKAGERPVTLDDFPECGALLLQDYRDAAGTLVARARNYFTEDGLRQSGYNRGVFNGASTYISFEESGCDIVRPALAPLQRVPDALIPTP